MPSPLEGLFDPPPQAATAKTLDSVDVSPLSAVLSAVQRHGGVFGVLQQLEQAGAGEVAQALLAGGLGSRPAAPGTSDADNQPKA